MSRLAVSPGGDKLKTLHDNREVAMPAVELPPDLVEKIEHSLSNGGSVDDFVRVAVEEKLDDTARRTRLHQLTAKIREAMLAKGLTEEEILADFEQHRHAQGAAKP